MINKKKIRLNRQSTCLKNINSIIFAPLSHGEVAQLVRASDS